MNSNRLIVLEGVEGAGKSTVISRLKRYCQEHNLDAVFTREPGGTPIGERIRDILIDNTIDERLDDKAELLLMYAARVQHIASLIKPALTQGKWVICDRFNWSSFAYQGGGRKLGIDYVKTLDTHLLGSLKAGLTLYLDIDPKLGLMRARHRHTLDRIEQEKIGFFERARDVFVKLTQNEANAVLIDASRPQPEVEEKVMDIIKRYINDNQAIAGS
ncbi:MAG: dTMP kinase [Francisellaceae bacterium]